MGFGSKSRKEAKRQQESAMAQQNAAFQNYQNQVAQYQASSAERNKGITALQNNASQYLERYNKGEDVASLNPAFAKTAQQAADAVSNTNKFASRLGDGAGTGDANYQAKLNSVSQRNIAKGLGAMNMQALEGEVQNQRGILMDTTNFLNSDAQAGLGMNAQAFDMTNSIFQNATTKRNMEIQRSNMMMQNMMGLISGGIQGAVGVMSMGTNTIGGKMFG